MCRLAARRVLFFQRSGLPPSFLIFQSWTSVTAASVWITVRMPDESRLACVSCGRAGAAGATGCAVAAV